MKTVFIRILLLLLSGAALADQPMRIMPLGDSITHGYWSGIGSTPYNSYRKVLHQLLVSSGHYVDFVGSLTAGDFSENRHEGHNGAYADHATSANTILGNIGGWLAGTPADIILLHIGTNDVNGGNEDPAEVSAVLDEIYTANSNATVVLALIINGRADYDDRADTTTFNSNLNAMAQARITGGADLIVVDMENGAGIDYSNPSADMNDKLHPSQQGYDKMATNWYPAVVQAILRQQGPRIDHMTATNNVVTIELGNLASNRPVNVEWSPELSSPAWTNHTTLLTQSLTTNLIFQASETSAFFRVVSP